VANLASTAVAGDIVDVIASEMARGIDRAVGWWMSQIEHALTDPERTSLGRLNAVREIVENYKGHSCERDKASGF